MKAAQTPKRVSFGVFELDVQTGELRKSGMTVRLRGQPFDVLAMLLERPGEVVTREELQQRLWPDGTFVDFDHSLNIAINKIREALADSAESPRFVETLPRRGYRFIAPVERTSQSLSRRAQVAILILTTLMIVGGLGLWLRSPVRPPRILGYERLTNNRRPKVGTLVTDGGRVYFTELVDNRWTLVQASTTGGDTDSIPFPLPNVELADISPSRSELLVASYAALEPSLLWILPLPGGPPRRLGDVRLPVTSPPSATWSPDGQWIVYAQDRALYLVGSDGNQPRKLVMLDGLVLQPRWSPDGKRLRFTILQRKGERSSLWEVAADGSGLHPLLPGWNKPAAECCGNWSSDGNYFVFESMRNNRTDIWARREWTGLLKRDRPEPVHMTTGPHSYYGPVSSRDGKKLFVVGEQLRGELVRYEIKSGQFVPYLSGISARFLDFSKDAKWVTYCAYPENTLWRSRVDGSQKLQLSSQPMEAFMPRWSPDGQRIAFFARTPGEYFKLYAISADGGTSLELLSEQRNTADPGWSPDGSHLVFGRLPFGETESPSIHLLALQTKHVSTLPGSEGLWSPRWSPDGRYVCALTTDSMQLMLYDFTTQKWIQLARGIIGQRNWSQRSDYIYFDNRLGQDPALLRVRIADREIERITGLKDLSQAFGRSAFPNPWSGLTPDNSPLVLRDASIQEIYALDWEAP